jgi:HK97 family phage portal protein
MQLSGVWACVKLIAETVASLPLTVYKKTENGRVIASEHPLSVLFSGKVNRYQTRTEFFETVVLNLIMHGNAYCLKQEFGGRLVGLLPLMSAQVETRLLADGSVVHQYVHDSGIDVLADSSVWHLKLMGNGIVGLSPLAHQRNTLGIAIAAEGAVTKIYRNGSKPSGVLTIDKVLTPTQRDEIRKSFATLTMGENNRLMVLEGGTQFQAISLSPQDIQLLESRKFQLSEICRWYGVPSVMVNDTSSTTVWGSGISEIVAGFYKVTLRPILEKIEASILANLMTSLEARRYEVEFDFNALTRGDMKARMDAYRIGIQGGILTPNECRSEEGRQGLEGGDKLYMQGATLPITELGKVKPTEPPKEDANGN